MLEAKFSNCILHSLSVGLLIKTKRRKINQDYVTADAESFGFTK